MSDARQRLVEALIRDNTNICEAAFPITHPATVMRLVAESASTYMLAWEVGDSELFGRANGQLLDAAALYRRYFPKNTKF